jgi:hypothetical protein
VSLSSATGTAALNVPATPQGALRQDAIGGAPQALPTMALGSEKEAATLVMAAVWATKKFGTAELYFAQVHGGSADDLYYITSPEALMGLVSDFASITSFC